MKQMQLILKSIAMNIFGMMSSRSCSLCKVAYNYPIAAILRDILSQISATFATGLYGNCPYLP